MNYLSQCLAALFASSVLVACGDGHFDSAAIAVAAPVVRIAGRAPDSAGHPLVRAATRSGGSRADA